MLAQQFEDTLDDVFALQDRVALAVAGTLEPTVQSAEIRSALLRPTGNLGSYDLYLRALQLYRSAERAEVLEALDLLNRAIALDPDYGVALGVAAVCHQFIHGGEWSDDPDANRRQGIELAHRALKAAGDDANALAYAAYVIAGLERDLDTAIVLFDKAIALNPGSAVAWLLSGFVRLRAGEVDLGIKHVQTASRLDPMGPNQAPQSLFMAMARFEQRRFVEAVALLRDYHQQRGTHFSYALLAACHGHLGHTAAALEALAQYRRITPLPVETVAKGFMDDSAHRRLFLDGIALAEGKPSAASREGG
jgi:tetratricopeptide (TPR) repeat protein